MEFHKILEFKFQIRDCKALDKFGNVVDARDPVAHIPIEDFVYRD